MQRKKRKITTFIYKPLADALREQLILLAVHFALRTRFGNRQFVYGASLKTHLLARYLHLDWFLTFRLHQSNVSGIAIRFLKGLLMRFL